jgi:anti-sigma28 factor (negative regulator of flagellin synthesis)
MKISNALGGSGGISGAQPPGIGGAPQSGAAQGGTSVSSPGFSGISSGDEVSLSGVSQVLQASSAQRTESLASLASSVRTGSYDVAGSEVARSMVSEILARSSIR